MSSEAKIGLAIVLAAVLVSVVLIGRNVSRDKAAGASGQPVAAASIKPVYEGAPPAGTQESSASGTFVVGGDSMGKLTESAAPEGLPGTPGTSGTPAPVATPAPTVTPVPVVPAIPAVETPKAPAAEVAAPAGKTHTVARKGETLQEIARKYYGSGSRSRTELIAKANPAVDFRKPLAAGTTLAIPEAPAKAEPAPKTADAPKTAPASGRIHRIESGETLSVLADRYLGAASRYPEIVAANPGMTKDSVLKVGQKIVIPDSGR